MRLSNFQMESAHFPNTGAVDNGYQVIRLRPNTLQLVGAKAGLATAQFRFDTPQVLPDGSASRAAGSFIITMLLAGE